jgi:hypothetical protein
MEKNEEMSVPKLIPSTMNDEEYKAMEVVTNYITKQLAASNAQSDPNYPYLNATCVDLMRMYGKETLARL